jgi:hypothetical protein
MLADRRFDYGRPLCAGRGPWNMTARPYKQNFMLVSEPIATPKRLGSYR